MALLNQIQVSKCSNSENLLGHRINIELEDGSMFQLYDLVRGAIDDIRNAFSIQPGDNSIKFSRVKYSSDYLENGTIEFDGYSEGEESLNELKRDFPKLHDAICLLYDHPTLLVQFTMMQDFRKFLLSLSNINEYAIFVLIGEKERIQKFSRQCCDYILNSSETIDVPVFSNMQDPELDRLTIELINSTTSLCSSIAGNTF